MKNAMQEIGFVPGVSPQAFDAMYTTVDICNLLQKAKCCRVKEDTSFNYDMEFFKFDNYPYLKDEDGHYLVYHADVHKQWPYIDGEIRLSEAEFNKYFLKVT